MEQSLKSFDPEVFEIAVGDLARQQNCLTLIPSENYASRAVMQAQSTVLANKYAEGYPGRRYYAGCENVDVSEQLAIDRAKELFGAEDVNVLPHSGSQANIAVFHALLSPGDTILSMKLDHGGHLAHGLPQNFSGKYYNIVHYGLDPETERINLETVANLADQHQPRLIIVGASAYPCQIDFAEWRKIADSVDALSSATCILIQFPIAMLSPQPPTKPCGARVELSFCAVKNLQILSISQFSLVCREVPLCMPSPPEQ